MGTADISHFVVVGTYVVVLVYQDDINPRMRVGGVMSGTTVNCFYIFLRTGDGYPAVCSAGGTSVAGLGKRNNSSAGIGIKRNVANGDPARINCRARVYVC